MYVGINAVKAVPEVEGPSDEKVSGFVLNCRRFDFKLTFIAIIDFFPLPRPPASRNQIDSIQEGALDEFLSHFPNSLNISRPGQPQYEDDIYHWAESSTYKGLLTYQPDTVKDIASFFESLNKVPGARIPFGVKSGGHTGNPGFSSSPGGLICMKRFDEVTYDPESKTAVIGAGQIWDDVYEKLAQHNVSVLGARVSHIGVGGFLLGGGYSWHTNQYGLAIDSIVVYELVKPDGTIVNVTEASDPDLFFALKGGGNNFGIVTKFTMKTFPQGRVWGGPLLFISAGGDEAEKKIKDLFNAIQVFINEVKDPKAAILASLGTINGPNKLLNLIVFYDAPQPPPGIFDIFTKIAPEETSVLWESRTYVDFVKVAMEYESSKGSRGTFHTVGLARYTQEFLQAIWDENEYWGTNLPPETTSRKLITYSVEPFLSDILTHGPASAYPPDRSDAFSPFPIYVSWGEPKFDSKMEEFAKKTTKRIQEAAEKNGIEIGPRYPNYAITGTPLAEMYGKNVEKLKKTKARIDPKNIMGRAGGFKF